MYIKNLNSKKNDNLTHFKSSRFETIQVSGVRSPIPHFGSQEGTYAEACEGT